MEQPTKDWVTHEAHRVFEEEFTRHAALIKETIRQTMKDELHPRHGEHHITYDGDLTTRRSMQKGMFGSFGGMIAQAFVIGIVLSAVMLLQKLGG